MIAITVHVNKVKGKKVYEVFPNRKEYAFIVPEKLEKKIKPGMIAGGPDKQILYIKKLVPGTDGGATKQLKYCKREEVFFPSEEELQVRKKLAQEKPLKEKNEQEEQKTKEMLAAQSIFKGHILILEDKKFRKTPETLKVRTNEKTYDLVKVGDIINVLVNKPGKQENQYILVEEISDKIKNKPKRKSRTVYDHFYKKTDKGYRKIRLDNELNIIKRKKVKKENKDK